MSKGYDEFMKLLKEGKHKEALAHIEAQKMRLAHELKYEPDEIISEHGKPPRFKKKGRLVERGEDRVWRLKNPRKTSN